jgi:dolichol-phosphate mannosyltransferase
MLSIVVPVLNEAESLRQLHGELDEVAHEESYELQTVFVDDGSTDGSWAVIEQLAAEDSRVLGIRFRRNFGKAAALAAGFDAASGQRIVMLDADLQDDPAEIPRLLGKLDEGCDLVSGWKRVRRDPWQRVAASRMFNWLVRAVTGVRLHDHNCGLKALRREVTHEIRLYGGLHRYLAVLVAARGFRIGEVEVRHRPRKYGKSKYRMTRFFGALVDLAMVRMVLVPRRRPPYVLAGAGIATMGIGGVGMIGAAAWWGWEWWGRNLAMRADWVLSLVYVSATLLAVGGLCVLLALVGETLSAPLMREADIYSIAEHTSPSASPRPRTAGKASDLP